MDWLERPRVIFTLVVLALFALWLAFLASAYDSVDPTNLNRLACRVIGVGCDGDEDLDPSASLVATENGLSERLTMAQSAGTYAEVEGLLAELQDVRDEVGQAKRSIPVLGIVALVTGVAAQILLACAIIHWIGLLLLRRAGASCRVQLQLAEEARKDSDQSRAGGQGHPEDRAHIGAICAQVRHFLRLCDIVSYLKAEGWPRESIEHVLEERIRNAGRSEADQCRASSATLARLYGEKLESLKHWRTREWLAVSKALFFVGKVCRSILARNRRIPDEITTRVSP